MDNPIKGNTLINSIIGEGTFFRGDLDLHGLLRIDGDFEGNIRAEGRVLVGKSGRARCVIQADTVVIGGVVKGDIRASAIVVLLSTGMIIGNIRSPKLIVEDGVLLHGNCVISQDEKVLAAVPEGPVEWFSPDWNRTVVPGS